EQEEGQSPHSGLGLWIARRHVEALGGRVSASNRPGGGLSIVIVLPRAYSARL
ncbi:MAG TPA: ATP-binding protein, partial [Reyranella sp.]|nr:ATP-binding protein [Reyranella sp.]